MPEAPDADAPSPGETLAARVRRGGRLDRSDAVAVARALGATLGPLHASGAVHGALSSESVVLEPGGRVRVELASPDEDRLEYRSPEAISGRAVDARSDQWSAAVLLFEGLTGALPFTGATPAELRAAIERRPAPRPSERSPSLGRGLDAVVARALKKDAVDRYASIEDACDALVAALEAPLEIAAEPPVASAVPPARPLPKPLVTAPQAPAPQSAVSEPPWGLAALLAVVLLGGGLYVLRVELEQSERAAGTAHAPGGPGLPAPVASVVPSVRLPGRDGDRALPLGRAFIMNVWLERCSDCMPSFEAWRGHVRAARVPDLPVVNVSAYHPADPAWAESYAVDANLVTDAGGSLVGSLGVGRFTTFIVGANGEILLRAYPQDPTYVECMAEVAKRATR